LSEGTGRKRSAGVQGTPTCFVNGRIVKGIRI
jgi:hypothetical protein